MNEFVLSRAEISEIPGMRAPMGGGAGRKGLLRDLDNSDLDRQTHGHHQSDWKHGRENGQPTLVYVGSTTGWYKAPPCESEWEEVYDESVVYIIHAKESKRVKIGRSRTPLKRLQSLQTGSPERLDLVCVLMDASEEELHHRFRRFRVHGEWFDDAILDEL